MKKMISIGVLFVSIFMIKVQGQTPVPNGGFETWVTSGGIENPQYWDTPNADIAFAIPFGTRVVTKSTDSHSGSFSARLESKALTIPPAVVPGVVTLGVLSINLTNLSYTLNGGVPISDKPTHLKGFFKYQPRGGDSCAIGVGLTKWNGTTRDSVGIGAFSTHDTVNVWTPFITWINYVISEQPDTFNILAISSADSVATAGTVLYVDDIALDYSVGIDNHDPSAGINIYQDREEKQFLVYLDFATSEARSIKLFNMTGQVVAQIGTENIKKERQIINYTGLNPGLYVMEIIHDGKKYSKKFLIND
jgi:hypothetical protein